MINNPQLNSAHKQPGNPLSEVIHYSGSLDQAFPDLVDDIKKKKRIIYLNSFIFFICICMVMHVFFDLLYGIPFIVGAAAGLGLMLYDLTCFDERLKSGPAKGRRFYFRVFTIMSLLVMTSIFISATKLEPSIVRFLEEQKSGYKNAAENDEEYKQVQKEEIELGGHRKNLKDELDELEKERIALVKIIEAEQGRLDAEASGITYEHPETGESIGSGRANNPWNPAANKEWNKRNAKRQEYIVEMNGVIALIGQRKNELAEVETEIKDVEMEKNAMAEKAFAEASNMYDDDAINKIGVFWDMLFEKNTSRAEAWVTLIFLMLLSGILEMLTWIVLFSPSRMDKEHILRYNLIAGLRNSLLIDKTREYLGESSNKQGTAPDIRWVEVSSTRTEAKPVTDGLNGYSHRGNGAAQANAAPTTEPGSAQPDTPGAGGSHEV